MVNVKLEFANRNSISPKNNRNPKNPKDVTNGIQKAKASDPSSADIHTCLNRKQKQREEGSTEEGANQDGRRCDGGSQRRSAVGHRPDDDSWAVGEAPNGSEQRAGEGKVGEKRKTEREGQEGIRAGNKETLGSLMPDCIVSFAYL